jgi:glutamyl-tRNA synthetase
VPTSRHHQRDRRDSGAGLGKVAQPIRVAVAGGSVSPPIDITLELLGRERTLARLDRALAHCAGK